MPKKVRAYFRKVKKIREVEDIRQLYDRSYYHGDVYENYTFPDPRKDFIEKAKLVKEFCSEGSRLLDVGCALGFFVKCALDEDFDAYGIDFSEYAIQKARELVGNRVQYADVETAIPFEDNFFDVVTVWDVLEHLKYPPLFLQKVGRVLKKNGIVFVTTLNYPSLLSRLMRDRWDLIAPGYHQTHTITVADLRDWMSRAGLREIRLSTFGFELESFYSKIGQPALRKMAEAVESSLRLASQDLLRPLAPLYLGDTISCVAKRIR